MNSKFYGILRLLRRLHEVMFKQLSPWLLFGMLSDRYGEFFIHKARKTKALASPPATDQEDELGIGGLSGEQLRDVQVWLSVRPSICLSVQFANYYNSTCCSLAI